LDGGERSSARACGKLPWRTSGSPSTPAARAMARMCPGA